MALYLTEKHIKYKNGKDDCVSPFFIYQNNKPEKKHPIILMTTKIIITFNFLFIFSRL